MLRQPASLNVPQAMKGKARKRVPQASRRAHLGGMALMSVVFAASSRRLAASSPTNGTASCQRTLRSSCWLRCTAAMPETPASLVGAGAQCCFAHPHSTEHSSRNGTLLVPPKVT
jgi:hypothetical protein